MDDDDEWQDMPIVRSSDLQAAKTQDLQDDDDIKRYHWRAPASNVLFDVNEDSMSDQKKGKKGKGKELASDYTRLELDEDVKDGQVHLSTDFLFDDATEMTPLSQMQTTKNLLSEGQRIAYVGLCRLVAREIVARYKVLASKENEPAVVSARDWANRIMGRLYLHMDVNASEQRMIDQLGDHGVTPADLVPSLMTTHTVANPEYDPEAPSAASTPTPTAEHQNPFSAQIDDTSTTEWGEDDNEHRKRERRRSTGTEPKDSHDNLIQPLPSTLPGVSTTLTARDATVTLDIRWTILCDLFLALIADSVYDARSRVMLADIAKRLDISWEDVIRFEKRLTEALAIHEGVDEADQDGVMAGRDKANKRRRIALMAAAGVGGGLVIGLSAGLLAPFIGAGIGATLGLVGISGTTTFLVGTGGAAIITSTGVLAGGRIATKGMGRRTASVKTFEFKPLHNNKRVSCWITVPGFMAGKEDDVRLPFSVLDAIIGDVMSVLWEPETILQTGDALKILTGEILTQAGQQILAATVMTALMSAVQLPIMLTKLSYLIDNPWSNALDRAKSAGAVLADILIQKHLGVRPISLIGFSLGARVIFYCLLELARTKHYGIVQEVYLMGTTVTASQKQWSDVRSVVAGRFVNAYARNDWILGYLFRATTGGLATVAGLRPVEGVPDLENVDITGLLTGHMSYRSSMPRILKHLGFMVTAEQFDEPDVDDILRPDREVLTREEIQKRTEAKERKANRWKWGRRKKAVAKPLEAPEVQETSSARRPVEYDSLEDKSIPRESPTKNSSEDATPVNKDTEAAGLSVIAAKEGESAESDFGSGSGSETEDELEDPGTPATARPEIHNTFDSPASDTDHKSQNVDKNEYEVDPTSFNTERLRQEIAAMKAEADNSPSFAPETARKVDYSATDLPSWTSAPSVEIQADEEDLEEEAPSGQWARFERSTSFGTAVNPFASSTPTLTFANADSSTFEMQNAQHPNRQTQVSSNPWT